MDIMGRPIDKAVYDRFNVNGTVCDICAATWDDLLELMRHLPYDLSKTPLAGVKEFWWNGRLYGTVC